MKRGFLPKELKYIRKHRAQRYWCSALLLLCAPVLFSTVYALVLPAITMEDCQIPEHTHSEACYSAADSAADAAVLVCALEEHIHSTECPSPCGH